MAKTEDIIDRIGNTPTPAGEEHPSIHGPFSPISDDQEKFSPVRVSKSETREGNTLHTSTEETERRSNYPADADGRIQGPPTHTRQTMDGSSLYGEPQRAGDSAPNTHTGLFPFQGTPESGEYIGRERVPRQEVQDAEIKSLKDKKFQNEKTQRKVSETLQTDITNPRNQR